eukprot:TRINITY_DN30661_c0_g1_i2.p2 TRINITY_DN30661_c0_g1~~TRINITY_DN30661_c0_g1_i2.p2  ORF type:complete len:133 (-),score=21.04 TRINITY_DN30661_c0_g1_i2:273-647(-)
MARSPSPAVIGHKVPGHRGLGHVSASGSGALNQFGRDFLAAGRKWSVELCKKDSDRDGRTNGEELGDPKCTWKKAKLSDADGKTGQVDPEVTEGITHPGVPDGIYGKVRATASSLLESLGIGEL